EELLIGLVVVVVEPVLHGAGRDRGQIRLGVEALDGLKEIRDIFLGVGVADVRHGAGAENDLAVATAGAAHTAAAGAASTKPRLTARTRGEAGGRESGERRRSRPWTSCAGGPSPGPNDRNSRPLR